MNLSTSLDVLRLRLRMATRPRAIASDSSSETGCNAQPAKGGAWIGGVWIIDLLMGLFIGAVFRHGGGARKQPIKQPTEMPTSTMALMGRFPSLMGRFPSLLGRFPNFVLRGRFTS